MKTLIASVLTITTLVGFANTFVEDTRNELETKASNRIERLENQYK